MAGDESNRHDRKDDGDCCDRLFHYSHEAITNAEGAIYKPYDRCPHADNRKAGTEGVIVSIWREQNERRNSDKYDNKLNNFDSEVEPKQG